MIAMIIFSIEKLAKLDVFQTALQYLMSLVTLQVFVSNGGIHEVDPACNTVVGFENYDTYIAALTSGIFYLFFMPFFYETVKVLVPGLPSYIDPDSGEVVFMRLHDSKRDLDDALEASDKKVFRKYYGFHQFLKCFSFVAPDLWWAQGIAVTNKYAAAHVPMDTDTSSPALDDLQRQEIHRWDALKAKSDMTPQTPAWRPWRPGRGFASVSPAVAPGCQLQLGAGLPPPI